MIGLACLCVLLWTFVPYQFAFVILFLMHFSTTSWNRLDEVSFELGETRE